MPYLEELYIERKTEKLNLAKIALKTPPNAMETEAIHRTRKGVDTVFSKWCVTSHNRLNT